MSEKFNGLHRTRGGGGGGCSSSRRHSSPPQQPTSQPQQQHSRQQPTPSPPLNEQSPQLQIGGGGGGGSSAEQQQRSQLHLSGMRAPQSLAEWQLQAVLFRAKLTQYFDVFISQGGDDIDQIMQCDETEFLEIMSLVGMASKPLHVRRLQRTLSEFSVNRAQFLISTVPFIGPPPIDFPSTSSSTDNLAAALQFLVPGYLSSSGPLDLSAALAAVQQQQKQSLVAPLLTPDFLFPLNSSTIPITSNQTSGNEDSAFSPSSLPLHHQFLLSLVNTPPVLGNNNNNFIQQQPQNLQQQQQQPSSSSSFSESFSKRARMSFSPPPNTPPSAGSVAGGGGMILAAATATAKLEPEFIDERRTVVGLSGEFETTIQQTSSSCCSSPLADRLNEMEIQKLAQLARELVASLPPKLEPRTSNQGKRRLERGLLEAIALPPEDPLRAEHFRLFARIYGRFDAKRRPDRALTRHERVVNEAAAQLSLLRPDLLVRRDELFPLARKLARMFELPSGCCLQISSSSSSGNHLLSRSVASCGQPNAFSISPNASPERCGSCASSSAAECASILEEIAERGNFPPKQQIIEGNVVVVGERGAATKDELIVEEEEEDEYEGNEKKKERRR